jgi:hypothetical protein
VKETKIMTPKQALKQAQARWGKNAGAQNHGDNFVVGRIMGQGFFPVLISCGSGKSWEDAFRNADERAEAARAKT